MSFTDNTREMEESQNSLYPDSFLVKRKKLPMKTFSRDDQPSAKADVWRTCSNQIEHEASNKNNFPKQDGFTCKIKLEDLANLPLKV